METSEALVRELDKLVSELDEIISATTTVAAGATVNDRLEFWNRRVVEWLRDNVSSNAVGEFLNKNLRTRTYNTEGRADVWRAYLHTVRLEIIRHPGTFVRPKAVSMQQHAAQPSNDLKWIEDLLHRFPAVAAVLRERHAGRPPLALKDEYDVQYLLNALLRIRFDDVRPEDVAPTYAGGSSRMDFILKAARIALEVKMPNPKLRDGKIGEQLLIDIARYQKHPDCRTLVCFVYDPNSLLKNPAGLVHDLGKKHGELLVSVVVAP